MSIGLEQFQYLKMTARRPVDKDERVIIGFPFWVAFTSPIVMKTDDVVLLDPREQCVELVWREGIVIYRRMWLN